MSISKVRLPNNTEEDIKAKYLIQSSSSDAVSAEFSARTVTDDAIANIQKIYGNTVVVSNNLVSNSATAILSRGFNQWDEELEQYSYNQTTGEKQQSGAAVRSVNKIIVIPSASYYFRAGISITFRLFLYYSNGGYKGTVTHSSGSVYQVPSDVYYIAFQLASSAYGTIYNNDICINISDTAKNGTYEPYNGHQIDLSISTLTGKLNGAGSSVVIFPDGMGYDGTNRDELYGSIAKKKVGRVDLGSLTWGSDTVGGHTRFFATLADAKKDDSLYQLSSQINSYGYISSQSPVINNSVNLGLAKYSNRIYIRNDTYDGQNGNVFKAAMNGVILNYELITYEEYTLDNALQFQYPVVAGGTEMILPTTGTAPMKMDVIYGNAADATSNLSSNFISVDSMKAFLNNLGTQMGGTWNMQYNNGKFEFTFSSS